MLNRLITWALGLAIVYLILTQAVPFLRSQFFGRPVSIGSESETADVGCFERAQQANDQLTTAARSFGQPPVDVDRWSSAIWEIESEMQSARSACNCSSETCEAASSALDEMSTLLSNLDGMVRGDSPGFANPANQQERVNKFLDQARSAAGF